MLRLQQSTDGFRCTLARSVAPGDATVHDSRCTMSEATGMIRTIDLPDHKIPAPGARSYLRLEDMTIALFNVDGAIYAIDDSCPHAGSSLLGGKLDGRMIQCPAHGLKFDLATGCMRGGGLAVRTHAIGLVNDKFVLTIAAPTPKGNVEGE